jgi:hypothetical protein
MSSQLHVPVALPPKFIWIGGWTGTRDDLDAVENRKVSCPYNLEKSQIIVYNVQFVTRHYID